MAKFKQQNVKLKDNKRIYFGDSDDSSMYWDGSELLVTTTISGITPSTDGHLTTKWYVDDSIATLSGSIVLDHANLTNLDYASAGHTGFQPAGNYVTDTEMTTISGDIVDQIPTDYVTDDELTTVSGDIIAQLPSLVGYATESFVTTVSGDIVSQIPTDYITDAEAATISGDIIAQIPSLTGYATEDYVTTVSGDIVAQIPDVSDFITDAEVATISGDIVAQIPTDYYTTGEVDNLLTTTSGDIVSQIPSLTGYATEAYVTTVSGDIVAQIPVDYVTSAELTTTSGDIIAQIGGGAFTDLSDVPSDYTSSSGMFVRVKSTEDGLEFIAGGTGGLSNIVEDTTPQLGGDLDMNAKNISMTPTGGGSDDTACGLIATMTVDVNSTGVGAPLFMAADGNFEDADASSTASMPCTAMALETGAGSKKVLLIGYVRNDGWAWTPGGVIFVSTTSGTLSQTGPTGSSEQVQVVGYATHADRMYFNPQLIIGEVL
jgi:DUF4097 and DUF4098 domain-containing protein YvlB